MFKSIECLKYLEYDHKKHIYSSLFKIIDNDFEEQFLDTTSSSSLAPKRIVEGAAVVSVYSKRSLNVPKNLFLLFKYIENRELNKLKFSVENQIEFCKSYVKNFDKYKENIEKYLVLI